MSTQQTLHTLTTPCDSPQSLALKLRYRSEHDPVLLLQDAVVLASQPRMVEQLNQYPLFLLSDDLNARGLTPAAGLNVTLIDYPAFVGLTLSTTQQVNW